MAMIKQGYNLMELGVFVSAIGADYVRSRQRYLSPAFGSVGRSWEERTGMRCTPLHDTSECAMWGGGSSQVPAVSKVPFMCTCCALSCLIPGTSDFANPRAVYILLMYSKCTVIPNRHFSLRLYVIDSSAITYIVNTLTRIWSVGHFRGGGLSHTLSSPGSVFASTKAATDSVPHGFQQLLN